MNERPRLRPTVPIGYEQFDAPILSALGNIFLIFN